MRGKEENGGAFGDGLGDGFRGQITQRGLMKWLSGE